MGIGSLGLLDGSEAQSLSVQIGLGADGFGFFDGFCCLGLIGMEFCAKFPNGPLPVGVYGCFGSQQLLRALLAFTWSSIASTRGVTLSDLEVTAVGEMLAGIPSRDASAISVLT